MGQQKQSVRVVCVEAAESRVIAGIDEPAPIAHGLVGISAGVLLPLIEQGSQVDGKAAAVGGDQNGELRYPGVIDEFAGVPSSKGVAMAKRLAEQEGLLVGPSSGAACVAALEIAQRP